MPIHYEEAVDHTVVITIDRPEAKNALDLYHFRDLAAAWRRFAEEDDAWIAIITGVGRNFMAGADLKTYIPQITELHKQISEGGVDEIDGCKLRDGTDAVLRGTKLYKPIIAAVNGPCVAGGMEMLGGIDIRIATPHAKFGVMEPKRGLFAGGGTTVRLPRQLAFPAAMEFLLTAEAFPAERALELGLLNELVEEDDAWIAIITGVERCFMAGADLKTYIPQITELHQQISKGGVDEIDGCKLRDGTDAVLRGTKLYKPIIAAVNGP
ncbi:MAG TPA: enoyl-CoA hydratase/isomerase family protein, partial [Acidimicrobiales bacterium]|nr:enoyl-CoA hydratase/isomerase family protein [Acidimicrobiales bacterium]